LLSQAKVPKSSLARSILTPLVYVTAIHRLNIDLLNYQQ
jgi:hypothetical protein